MTRTEIRLTVPADSRFVATARVATASVAAELEYSIDEIEELRVGVNELVAVLVEWAEDHATGDDAVDIDLVFRMQGDDLEIEGRATAANGTVAHKQVLDALAGQILSSVVDEYEISGGWGRILKRRAAG